MSQTHNQADSELKGYIAGRRDELGDTYRVLEIVRRQGFINTETAQMIIDYLNKVDRRPVEMRNK